MLLSVCPCILGRSPPDPAGSLTCFMFCPPKLAQNGTNLAPPPVNRLSILIYSRTIAKHYALFTKKIPVLPSAPCTPRPMSFSKTLRNRLIAGLAAAGCAIAATPAITAAQSGLTIFSGVDRPNLLNYVVQHGGRNARNARYRLRIPANKVESTVAQVSIYIPDYFGEPQQRFRNLECVENCESNEERPNRNEERPNRVFAFQNPNRLINVRHGRNYSNSVQVGNAQIEENCYRSWDGSRETFFHCLRVPLLEPVPARRPIEVSLERVRNPWFGGTFYFHALLVTCLDEGGCFTGAGDEPVNDTPEFADFRRATVDYVGTWIVSITD
ncbi:MAG: DUF2808 domain-containing protein [Spirulina sp. DLM2.Bin59]|nr:MAG: DUF2808 domain-containing protein [Spirulina sp. DLM2.Bin59]